MRRFGALLAWSVAVFLVLSLVGSAAGPRWEPPAWTVPAPVAGADTTIAPALPATPPVGTYGVRRFPAVVHLEPGVSVDATVRLPEGAPGPVPGVVILHGTGTWGADAFFDLTEALASAGVASIVTAKRGTGYTAFERDYDALAADYARSVEALRGVSEVDAERVGLYGESEGAMIAPLLASTDERLAFLVLSAAPVVPLREQSAFAADNYLRNTHVPVTVRRAIPRVLGGPVPDGLMAYLDVDVRPALRRVTQPVLTVYGTADTSMPLIQGPSVLSGLLSAPQTVRYYADGTHGLRIDGVLIPEFPRDVARWIELGPGGAGEAPTVAGAVPVQVIAAGPVPKPWVSLTALVVVAALGLAGVLVGVMAGSAAVVSDVRTRRHLREGGAAVRLRDLPGGGRRLRGSGTRLVLAVALLWYCYAFYFTEIVNLALNYRINDAVVRGGLAVVYTVALLAAGCLVAHARRIVAERGRLRGSGGSVPLGGSRFGLVALIATTTGAVALQLVAAYVGAHPLLF